MKPKFELEGDDTARSSERLIDPDALDASEQRFAASLEQVGETEKASFVLDADEDANDGGDEEDEPPAVVSLEPATREAPSGASASQEQENLSPGEAMLASGTAEGAPLIPAQPEIAQAQDPDAWRNEVAARVDQYRARRRPREPRYPSLQLKFEPYEPLPNRPSAALDSSLSSRSGRQAISLDSALPSPETATELIEHVVPQIAPPETTARILEFPRSSSGWMPPVALDELAEPMFDRPRILEVPDVEPPPPALGGILIEPVEEPASERRPGFEVPLQSAPMSRRLAGVGVDALVVLAALGAFSCLFVWITAAVPQLRPAAGTMVALAGIFWVAYQYLLLVYTGITPGLKLAKLRLSRFDGAPVPRKMRRWRVLASVLSGLSLGLGYAWCFLDEDELCWHDRITRTYIAPIK